MGLEQFAGLLQGGPTVIMAVFIWLMLTDKLVTAGRHKSELDALELRRKEDNELWRERFKEKEEQFGRLQKVMLSAFKVNSNLARTLLGRPPHEGAEPAEEALDIS